MEEQKGFEIISLIQNEHTNYLEKHDVLNKLILGLLDKDEPWKDIKEFLEFFNNVILEHFEDEAEVIKLLLHNNGLTEEGTKTVNTVLQEHSNIIKHINQLNSTGKIYTPLLREVKEDFIANAHELIDIVTKHASMEDLEFFPLARNLLSKSELEQLKNTIETKHSN